jgi:glycosyltransferase involved in cell wall biosynthesis
MTPDISIIVPVLCHDDDLNRCVASIRAALKNKVIYEVIVVAKNAALLDGIAGYDDFHIFSEETPGIYGAMNTGISKATGRFLFFIGQDDILLPSTVEAIIQGKKNEADLILANVFWGNDRIFRNYPYKMYLAWSNWCHQGVIYSRERFIKEVGEYQVQFKAQADHYANIVFSSVPSLKIVKYHGCIAWYSADGFSSRSPDFVFRPLFPNMVRKHIGFFSYYCVVIRRFSLSLWKLCQGGNR